MSPSFRFVPGLALACLVAALLPVPSSALETGAGITVRVDARVEFAAVLCRLAGFEEYSQPGIASYDRAVEAHFGRFRGHPLIAALGELREEVGLGFNMPVEIALASEPGSWAPRFAGESDRIDARWTVETAARFRAAARELWDASDADAFFAARASDWARVEALLRERLVPAIDPGWLAQRFGPEPRAELTIVAGLLNGPHSYGPHFDRDDGVRESYAVLATPAMDGFDTLDYPFPALVRLLVHELHHPWVNPWVDANAARLQPGAAGLFEAVAETMRRENYGRWEYMSYETLVRAHTLAYFQSRGDALQVRQLLQTDRSQGFPWVQALARRIEAAATSGRFDAAAGTAVFEFFDALGRDSQAGLARIEAEIAQETLDRQRQGAQLAGLEPADGARVAAGDGRLRLRFDRPMKGSVHIGGELPEVVGAPTWSEDGRMLEVPVRFAAGARYRLLLNDESKPELGFVGRDGAWLVPRVWQFDVDAAHDAAN